MSSIKTKIRGLIFVFFASVPVIGFAAGIAAVSDLVNKISKYILNPLIYLMFAISTIVFIWGVKNFIGSADDAEARSKGAQQMIWGVVGAMIMISAAALVTIISNTATKL